MDDPIEAVRLAVYRALAADGRVPSRDELAETTGLSDIAIDEAIDRLASARHLVLDEVEEIVLAHPFATRDFGFSVKGDRTLWWGGCAWDAFAIPHLVDDEPSVLVATTCQACGTGHAWVVDRSAPPEGEQLVHFLMPMAHVWDDVVHACSNQRIFCDQTCVDDWIARTGNTPGAVFGLSTLWHLASGWYAGRLTEGYRRREPHEAAAYFASVGLTGIFWGS